MASSQIEAFIERMRSADQPEVAIRTFAHHFKRLQAGETGLIPEEEIRPAAGLPSLDELPDEDEGAGRAALDRTVLIKLNGGLGTSMGMQQAKTLLPVKGDLRFLDIIARHALAAGVPLVLMNSFATRADSLEALAAYPALKTRGIPLDFVQHRFPKVVRDNHDPAEHLDQPELAWNPPGHGDLYPALLSSGLLDALLDAGIEFAFVSNGDNLGASLDSRLLGYFARNEFPFMMEVAERTAADRKGGHLAEDRNGGLLLRESAQCPPEDEDAFQDITRHRYFNTNNLWVHLPALKARLNAADGVLDLPLILNRKTLDPRDPDSTPVYQLETAMGSAISVFEGAQAIHVPRTRFAPVKTTDDLLAVRSDAYEMTDDFRVLPARVPPPDIHLDPAIYKLIDDFNARFPLDAPSLRNCSRLRVDGDVLFGKGVKLRGDVHIRNPDDGQLVIPDDAELFGDEDR